jgi:hypothetical protein
MLPGTILVFLGASDPFLGTRDASLGATLLLGNVMAIPRNLSSTGREKNRKRYEMT